MIDVTIHNLVDKKVGISWQKGFNVRPANRGKSFRGDWTAVTLPQKKKRGERVKKIEKEGWKGEEETEVKIDKNFFSSKYSAFI